MIGVAHILEHGQEVVEIVPIERAYVIEAQLLEERATRRNAARIFLRPLGHLAQALGEEARQLLGDVTEAAIGVRGDHAREIGTHGAHGRGDRHVVVIEHDHQAGPARTGIVHRLIGHAGAHGTIADDGHHIALGTLELGRHRHTQPRRDRGRAVGRAEGIVLALGTLGETRETARLAQRTDAIPPSSQDLVWVALMADIEDQPVIGRVEDMMQRDSELDHAETRSQMAAGHRNRIDRLGPQLVGELP